jgi:hypothetical protein
VLGKGKGGDREEGRGVEVGRGGSYKGSVGSREAGNIGCCALVICIRVSRPHTARLGSYHTLLQSQLLETRPTHGLTTVGNLPRTTFSLEQHCTNISLDWRRGKIVWTSTRSAPTWLDFGFWVWCIPLVILYLASHAPMPFGRLGEGLRPSPPALNTTKLN